MFLVILARIHWFANIKNSLTQLKIARVINTYIFEDEPFNWRQCSLVILIINNGFCPLVIIKKTISHLINHFFEFPGRTLWIYSVSLPYIARYYVRKKHVRLGVTKRLKLTKQGGGDRIDPSRISRYRPRRQFFEV